MTADAIHRNTLSDVLWRAARRDPHKLAVRCGPASWTYAEFDSLVSRAARGLTLTGLGAGDPVAVLSRNSHSFAVLRFALARIGAVLVPVNFMLLPAEVAHILRHSGSVRLCIDTEFAELGRQAVELAPAIKRLIWLPGERPSTQPPNTLSFDDFLEEPEETRECPASAQAVAEIMYTSGTESLPKGVLLTHGAVITQYLSCIIDLEISSDDRVLHSMPMYHTAQLDCFLGPALMVGAFNLIISVPEPERILRLIAAERLTSFFAPPSIWIALLRSPVFDELDLSCLQKGYYGASIMPLEILREMQRRLPQLRLWNAYGQTEIAPLATVLKPGDQIRKAGSAGRPVINVETRVVREDMADADVGEIGEVVHRSPQLLVGYLNDPVATAAAFSGDWFHSGDLGMLDSEGYLTIVDRKKDMIKSGGENVASREVEECLYKLEGVSEVAVIGLPDPRWVEAVTAVLVCKRNVTLSEAGVLSHCAQVLGKYKRPKRVIFVDALPRNASGKIMKRELRRQYTSQELLNAPAALE